MGRGSNQNNFCGGRYGCYLEPHINNNHLSFSRSVSSRTNMVISVLRRMEENASSAMHAGKENWVMKHSGRTGLTRKRYINGSCLHQSKLVSYKFYLIFLRKYIYSLADDWTFLCIIIFDLPLIMLFNNYFFLFNFYWK